MLAKEESELIPTSHESHRTAETNVVQYNCMYEESSELIPTSLMIGKEKQTQDSACASFLELPTFGRLPHSCHELDLVLQMANEILIFIVSFNLIECNRRNQNKARFHA